MVGYTIFGSGMEKVIIIHDWFADHTSYDPMLNYLDDKTFTYAFMDLRGYGKSKDIKGEYTVNEAAEDVLKLADELDWRNFHLIGHSMSGMIAQYITLKAKDRIKSMVTITPVPANGMPGTDDDGFNFMKAATTDKEVAKQAASFMSGNRLSQKWVEFKVKNWFEKSTAEARAGYLHMFVKTDFSKEVQGLDLPILVIAGKYDAESLNENVQRETFLKWYPNATLEVFENSAHYPMQETPVYLATKIEEFLNKHI
jgi:pimeloyl-ACP methyl ester carboxylesterase